MHRSFRVAKEAWRFSWIGAVGFCVDGGLLLLSHEWLNLNWSAARLLSFTIAVTITWFLNRTITFGDRAASISLEEWRRYFAVNGIGALINLGIFLFLIECVPLFSGHPLVTLAVAAAIALAFNFFGSRRFVFRANPVGQASTDA